MIICGQYIDVSLWRKIGRENQNKTNPTTPLIRPNREPLRVYPTLKLLVDIFVIVCDLEWSLTKNQHPLSTQNDSSPTLYFNNVVKLWLWTSSYCIQYALKGCIYSHPVVCPVFTKPPVFHCHSLHYENLENQFFNMPNICKHPHLQCNASL